MINSIKQAIETIEDVINNNFSDEVKTVYFEKYSNTHKDKTFPQLSFYYADGSNVQVNVNQIALDFEFLDVVTGRLDINDRRKEVVSDCYQIASKFISYLRNETELNIVDNVSIELFDNKYKDGLGGVSFTLIINIAKPCIA